MCGASAEIIAQVIERLQGVRDIRVRRMGFEPVVCPTTKNLENLYYPDARRIAAKAYALVHGDSANWLPAATGEAPEVVEFKGPF